jgi:hypothetical protein
MRSGMGDNGKWLFAFWKACRLFSNPACRPIARLDEWALTRLISHARGVEMGKDGWFHYLRGAVAALGIDPPLVGIYEHEGGSFVAEDGDAKRRLVMWTPSTSTLSVGIYWANMNSYIFAIFNEDDAVSVLTKSHTGKLAKELLHLVREVAGEGLREKVLRALGGGE